MSKTIWRCGVIDLRLPYRSVAARRSSFDGARTPHQGRRCVTWFGASRRFYLVTHKLQGGESRQKAPILRFPLSFEKGLSVPVKKRDLNRKGLVKRGKNFRRPSWEQAEIESKRKRPSSSRSFDEQLELERYAEEDDLGDPSSPIANHLSRVTYDEVKEEPVTKRRMRLCGNHTHFGAS